METCNNIEVARQAPRSRQSAIATLFAIPKPFEGHIGVIQENALRSWMRLAPEIEIVLVGDEVGIAEVAAEYGVTHISDIQKNEFGTPLLSSAFKEVISSSGTDVSIYCNADVILMRDFVDALRMILSDARLSRFLAIGRRTDLDVQEEVDFHSQKSVEGLMEKFHQNGVPGAVVCKEFFVFPNELYSEVPDFAVGRGNWDNWMVASARKSGIPIVDVGPVTTVIHQNHDYTHIRGNRMECYVTGEEARRNESLAGGRNLIRGACSTWVLSEKGARPKKLRWANLDFWTDTVPFMRLVLNLLGSRR